MSVKDQVLQAIHQLPDDIDFRDVTDEVAFLAAVREAQREIDEGRLVTNEQMKARIAEWILERIITPGADLVKSALAFPRPF